MQNITIKEINVNHRPMEKMQRFGIQSLSNSELLAILIGSGTREKNAISLSNEILLNFDSGQSLSKTSIEQLMEIKGVGLSKATKILAGLELGKRLSILEKRENITIDSPKSIADYLFVHYSEASKEEFCAILLDTKNKIIMIETISVGTLNKTLVHPREVFRTAILRGANSIIFSHNHPSGDPTPSPEDISITEQLIVAGEHIGIKVLDHLVIGNNKYISLRENGLVKGFL